MNCRQSDIAAFTIHATFLVNLYKVPYNVTDLSVTLISASIIIITIIIIIK